MSMTLQEIAEYVCGQLIGDSDASIRAVAPIEDANEGDLTFLANVKYRPFLETTQASAILVSRDVSCPGKTLIQVDDPYLAFAQVLTLISKMDDEIEPGIHPTAVLGKNVELGDDVSIMAYVVLDDHVRVGSRSVIYPHVYVGKRSVIGCDCVIHSHVSLRERVVLGDRVTLHCGTVIGSDGFGFAQDGGMNVKIPQVGSVVIEEDVEIGSNVSIDRGTMGKTVIGKGTKMDNLIQVGHNVSIGENCVIVSQTGISGSTKIGKGVMLGGQVGIVGHVSIGDGSKVAARSGVSKDLKAGSIVSGAPAIPIRQNHLLVAYTRRLPDLFRDVETLKKMLSSSHDVSSHDT